MTRSSVIPFAPQTQMEIHPDVIAQGGAAYARALFLEQLHASLDVEAICQILNLADLRLRGLEPCSVQARDLKDGRRLLGLANAAVRSLEPDVVEEAVEAVAHVICEGLDDESSAFENQHATIQTRYRRWGQRAVNSFRAVMEGRS